MVNPKSNLLPCGDIELFDSSSAELGSCHSVLCEFTPKTSPRTSSHSFIIGMPEAGLIIPKVDGAPMPRGAASKSCTCPNSSSSPAWLALCSYLLAPTAPRELPKLLPVSPLCALWDTRPRPSELLMTQSSRPFPRNLGAITVHAHMCTSAPTMVACHTSMSIQNQNHATNGVIVSKYHCFAFNVAAPSLP